MTHMTHMTHKPRVKHDQVIFTSTTLAVVLEISTCWVLCEGISAIREFFISYKKDRYQWGIKLLIEMDVMTMTAPRDVVNLATQFPVVDEVVIRYRTSVAHRRLFEDAVNSKNRPGCDRDDIPRKQHDILASFFFKFSNIGT
jgi:hypothetical protein